MLRGRPLAWNWSENVQKMSRDPPIRVRFQVRGFLATILPVAVSRRSLMQNTLRYQVHDTTKPHRRGRHGRADIGCTESSKGAALLG